MQNLVPVLLAIPHAAAAFPHYEGGWGEVTCPILPKPFLPIPCWLARFPQAPWITDHSSSPCTADLGGGTWWKLVELFLFNSLLAG